MCWPYVLLQCVSSHPISCQTFHIQCTEEIRPRPSPDTGQLHYPVLCQFLEIHSIKQLSSTLEHRTKFVQSIYFNSSHVSHISIFSGFYAHWTCECQKGLCCQNWVHTGGKWGPREGQSGLKYGSWQCPTIPLFSGRACTSKFPHWPPIHCQGPVPQLSLPWWQPRLKYIWRCINPSTAQLVSG